MLPIRAEKAATAVGRPGKDHVVAWTNSCNADADFFDDPGAFMTQDGRQSQGNRTGDGGIISVANPTRHNSHLHSPWTGRAYVNVLDHQGFLNRVQHGSFQSFLA